MFKRVAPQTPGTAGIPQTEAMTSRPAAPESETPLVLGLQDIAFALQKEGSESWAIICREAATALSLAQTEIKGHMRVEDELKTEVANYRARESDLDLGVLHRALDKAQARIAELEKDAARYRWLNQTKYQSAMRTSEDEMTIGVAFHSLTDWEPNHFEKLSERLDAAIDAALKSHI